MWCSKNADMLELTKGNEIVKKTASAVLKEPAGVQCVMSEPTADSQATKRCT